MLGPEQILNALRNWKIEMNSPYNDGWVKQGYRENFEKIKEFFQEKYLDKALDNLACGSLLGDYEDELELYETYGGD